MVESNLSPVLFIKFMVESDLNDLRNILMLGFHHFGGLIRGIKPTFLSWNQT